MKCTWALLAVLAVVVPTFLTASAQNNCDAISIASADNPQPPTGEKDKKKQKDKGNNAGRTVPLARVICEVEQALDDYQDEVTTPLKPASDMLPGLATALALLSVYGGWSAFRSSMWFIVAGHVVFTLPFMVRSVAAVCAGTDLRTMEEGAASLGASFSQRFLTIVLPNARPGIVAGALAVLTLSIGEFNLTWMLHTPDTKTLPVGLADAYASMRLEVGSAYTILFLLMTLPLLIAMQWLGVDPAGAQSARVAARRKRALVRQETLEAAAPTLSNTPNTAETAR